MVPVTTGNLLGVPETRQRTSGKGSRAATVAPPVAVVMSWFRELYPFHNGEEGKCWELERGRG